jgi:hypothetical protein
MEETEARKKEEEKGYAKKPMKDRNYVLVTYRIKNLLLSN